MRVHPPGKMLGRPAHFLFLPACVCRERSAPDEPQAPGQAQLRGALKDAEGAKAQLERELAELRKLYNDDVRQLQGGWLLGGAGARLPGRSPGLLGSMRCRAARATGHPLAMFNGPASSALIGWRFRRLCADCAAAALLSHCCTTPTLHTPTPQRSLS